MLEKVDGVEKRECNITIKFTKSEREFLHDIAEKAGLKLAPYLRKMIITHSKELEEFIKEDVVIAPLLAKDYRERPRKTTMKDRTCRTNFYVTPEEKAFLAKKAKEANLPYHSYLYMLSQQYKHIIFPEQYAKDLKVLNQQLLKVGTNINQLVKLANLGVINNVNLEEVQQTYSDILFYLNEVHDEIKKHME